MVLIISDARSTYNPGEYIQPGRNREEIIKIGGWLIVGISGKIKLNK
jgi:hypothetical protein